MIMKYAFQYPIIFCRGEDGYEITLKYVHPQTDESTSKSISTMEFYSNIIMMRTTDYRGETHQLTIDDTHSVRMA
jgi:hypothetical protein